MAKSTPFAACPSKAAVLIPLFIVFVLRVETEEGHRPFSARDNGARLRRLDDLSDVKGETTGGVEGGEEEGVA